MSPEQRVPLAIGLGLGLMALVALSSCAPVLATFVQPQAPGGAITNGFCPPQPVFLLFERDGVVLATHTRFAGSGRQSVFVSFEVPAHRRVQLHGSSLEATTARGERVVSPMTGTWYGSGNRSAEAHPDSMMRGNTERLRYGTNTGYKLTHHEFFLFTAEYATALGDTFTVTLPKITVDGFTWDTPQVRFVRVRRWLITPINC